MMQKIHGMCACSIVIKHLLWLNVMEEFRSICYQIINIFLRSGVTLLQVIEDMLCLNVKKFSFLLMLENKAILLKTHFAKQSLRSHQLGEFCT